MARHDIGETPDCRDVYYFFLCQSRDGAAELREECLGGEHGGVVLRKDRDLAMARIEPPSVSKPKPSRGWDIKTETTVVLGSRANVVAIGGVGRP